MGTTAHVHRREPSASLGLDDDGFLELDQSWLALDTMISSVFADEWLSEDGVGSDEVARLAKVLRPLTWAKALDTCETPEHEALEEVEGFYEAFRELVLTAAAEGNGIRWDFT